MERFQEELSAGRQQLRTADHLVSITFPLVKDNKLLLAALESLSAAAISLMASLLHYEEAFKRIPHFKEDHDSMIYWFKSKCVPRYGLSNDYRAITAELKLLHDEHMASAIEFSRKDCLVICSDTYRFRKITPLQIKSYVAVVKRMLSDVEEVVSRYEGVFGRGQGRIKAC